MGFVIVLILLGVCLLLAELLLVPGVGVAGVLGLLSLTGSCVYSFWHFGPRIGTVVIVINIILVVVFTVYALRAKTWKKFALNTKIDSSVAEGETPLKVGDVGVTTTRLAPMGSARFDGKLHEVKSLQGMLDAGVEVEVILIEDNKPIVKPKEDVI